MEFYSIYHKSQTKRFYDYKKSKTILTGLFKIVSA